MFQTFVRKSLLPALEPEQVVIIDNLATHKSPETARLIEAADARVLYRPLDSPDFNPIELAISKIKTILRELAQR